VFSRVRDKKVVGVFVRFSCAASPATNKLFTVNVIIPTTNYIAAVFVNGVSKTDSLIFNGGRRIFVDSNEVTIQSLTVVFTDNATTPTHVISAVSSYYA
jgi:hypothetical protein